MEVDNVIVLSLKKPVASVGLDNIVAAITRHGGCQIAVFSLLKKNDANSIGVKPGASCAESNGVGGRTSDEDIDLKSVPNKQVA